MSYLHKFRKSRKKKLMVPLNSMSFTCVSVSEDNLIHRAMVFHLGNGTLKHSEFWHQYYLT